MRRRDPPGARRHVPRDQPASSFAAILGQLLERTPGARAAVLVDFEGETVDYAGSMAPFDLRIAAAHFRIVLDAAAGLRQLGTLRSLAVRAAKRTYLAYELGDGYALVLVLARRAGLFGWERAVSDAATALAREAGWKSTPKRSWHAVDVDCDARGRPMAIILDRGTTETLEILGTVIGLRSREHGWRVRLRSGVETTLVREIGGVWYCDEPLTVAGLTPAAKAGEESR